MNWLWDRNISEKAVKKILKNPNSSKFIEYSALLLSRMNSPEIVFKNYISPVDFCKKWRKIKREMRKNNWSEPKIVYWDAIYEKTREKLIEKGVIKKGKEYIPGDPYLEKIGEEIRKLRKEKNLTQKQLARKLGISQQIVSRIERGKENISLKNLGKISSILGKNLKITFEDADNLGS